MSGMSYEQENHILDQLNGRQVTHKMQNSDVNRNMKKPMSTPMNHTLKTSDKSSRKAFGNVSNVLHSETKHSIATKAHIKNKGSAKESDLRSDSTKMMATESENDHKFFDDIEEMHPIEEELMSDMRDSLTYDLFAIDDNIALNMEFDSDMTECLLPNKHSFDLSDFL